MIAIFTGYSYKKPLQACKKIHTFQSIIDLIDIGQSEQDGLAVWRLSTGELVTRHRAAKIETLIYAPQNKAKTAQQEAA